MSLRVISSALWRLGLPLGKTAVRPDHARSDPPKARPSGPRRPAALGCMCGPCPQGPDPARTVRFGGPLASLVSSRGGDRTRSPKRGPARGVLRGKMKYALSSLLMSRPGAVFSRKKTRFLSLEKSRKGHPAPRAQGSGVCKLPIWPATLASTARRTRFRTPWRDTSSRRPGRA